MNSKINIFFHNEKIPSYLFELDPNVSLNLNIEEFPQSKIINNNFELLKEGKFYILRR